MRLALAFALLTARAWACSCAVSPVGNPPCQSVWRHDAVFTGMVVEIAEPASLTAPPRRQVRFRIAQALNGIDPKQQEIVIETGLGGGDCGYNFTRGRDYIVYAYKGQNGLPATGICSPTRPLEDAAEDLAYFRQLPKAPPTAEVRVTTLPALTGVRVVLTGPGVRQAAVTDASGRHVFDGLPAGEYRVEGSLEGYASPGQMRPIQVHAKGCAEVPVGLHIDRRLTGQVFRKDGSPASGVTVEAVAKGQTHAAASAVTDENGRYQLGIARAGDYYLGVSLTRPPRWFYPGTDDPAAAAILQLTDTPGAFRYDLTLPEPHRERLIRGIVLRPDGSAVGGARVTLEDPSWPGPIPGAETGTDKDGRFTLRAVDRVRYLVRAMTYGSAPMYTEAALVEPGRDPLDLKLVLTRAGRPAPATAPPR